MSFLDTYISDARRDLGLYLLTLPVHHTKSAMIYKEQHEANDSVKEDLARLGPWYLYALSITRNTAG